VPAELTLLLTIDAKDDIRRICAEARRGEIKYADAIAQIEMALDAPPVVPVIKPKRPGILRGGTQSNQETG
jgi:hypothetical protein